MTATPFLTPRSALDRQTLGKYEVLCRLSTGGMSEIFLAHQKGLAGFRKIVVLKSILPDISGEEEFVRMFLDEARTTAAFNHPNIAQVYDLDVDDGVLFLAMEFVQGCTLVEMARACRQAREPIPIGFTLQAVRDTALALHYAHTFIDPRGRKQVVIHRDVAEKNIMVTYEGTTKLLDFGIAKALGRAGHTTVGMVKGTSGYMSPEQIRGETLDPRSDIFSLGVVLHECLTGMRLFHGKNPEDGMLAALKESIAPPSRQNSDVTNEIDAVVMKSLEKERDRRFATSLEFARAIERAAGSLIWHPEQSGELVNRHFKDRRSQTRDLVEASQEGAEHTGEVKIDKLLITAKPVTPVGDGRASQETVQATPEELRMARGGATVAPPARRDSKRDLRDSGGDSDTTNTGPPPAPPAPRLSRGNLPRVTDEIPKAKNRSTSDATTPGLPSNRASTRNLPPVSAGLAAPPPPSGSSGPVNVRLGPQEEDDEEGAMMKTMPATDLDALLKASTPGYPPPPTATPPVPAPTARTRSSDTLRRPSSDSLVTHPDGMEPEKPFNPFEDMNLEDDIGSKTNVLGPGAVKPRFSTRDADEGPTDGGFQPDEDDDRGTLSQAGPRRSKAALVVVAMLVLGGAGAGFAWYKGLLPGSKPAGKVEAPPKKDVRPDKPPKVEPAPVDKEAAARAAAAEKARQDAAERERIAKETAEEERRLAAEAEKAKADAEKAKQDAAANKARLAQEKADKAKADRAERQRLAQEKAERVRAERAERQRLAQEKAAADREARAEKAKADAAAPAASGTPGTMTLVVNPPGLQVWAQGKPVGKTPLFKFPMPPGKHKVEFRDATGAIKTMTVKIKASEDTSVRSSWDQL